MQPDETFAPTAEDVARRQAALARSLGRFDAVAAKMHAVYGLRLPRHVAVWDAFDRSLTPLEREGLDQLGRAPSGIMTWFDDGGLERPTRNNLDPRLDCRYRADPPELVTIMSGDTDGLHYGLWYDDPAELPSCLASNYARDSAETSADQATAIRELLERANKFIDEPDYPEEPTPVSVHAVRAALRWFVEPDDVAVTADGPPRYAGYERGEILGGMMSALPDDAGDPRATYHQYELRAAAYRARSPAVAEWIADARAELASGKPAFALTLGRELHWLDADDYRKESLALLCSAYLALGRQALAAIAVVHHANRDLPFVGVY